MQIEWQQFAWFAGLLILWSGFLVGIIRQMLSRLYSDLEKRVDRIDAEFKAFLVRLPVDYQRRDDSIREFTVINAKLDRMYEYTVKGK